MQANKCFEVNNYKVAMANLSQNDSKVAFLVEWQFFEQEAILDHMRRADCCGCGIF